MGFIVFFICLLGIFLEYDFLLGDLGLILGWGRIEVRDYVYKFRGVKLFVVFLEKCRQVKGNNFRVNINFFVFIDNMICVGGERGIDSCDGDSGGVFVIQYFNEEVFKFYVVGLVFWGFQCGIYGIYIRVKNYVDWIMKIMQGYSSFNED